MTSTQPDAIVAADQPHRRVLLAKPRGYCAGVDRAVQTVELALDHYGAPVYVRKQIVHNLHVVRALEARGAIFVEETDEVPEGALVVFSAHGVAPSVHAEAAQRGLKAIDATCPLVTKVHHEVRRFATDDFDILLIGHEGHEEVVGTSGEAPENIIVVDGPADVAGIEVRDPEKVVWLSQTTLSVDETMQTVDALRERFPSLQAPPSDDICYATQNRQAAVKTIAPQVELFLVVGSANSSNSVRMVEVAARRRPRGAPGRERRGDRSGLARRRHVRGPVVGRVGARDPGARGHRLAGRARLRRSAGGQPHRGAAHVRAAAGAAPRSADRRHARRAAGLDQFVMNSAPWRDVP